MLEHNLLLLTLCVVHAQPATAASLPPQQQPSRRSLPLLPLCLDGFTAIQRLYHPVSLFS